MPRLTVLVEGQTEENFVNQILAPHLYTAGFTYVSASLMGNARPRSRRGGCPNWDSALKDISNHLLGDPYLIVTTMVDFYRMHDSWPGRQEANARRSAPDTAHTVEKAVLDSVVGSFRNIDPRRFVPYVVMHEFEGLLFSDTMRFAGSIGHPKLSAEFEAIVHQFDSPEDINDSYETSPGHRVKALAPRYQKALDGIQAAQEIGLETIRRKCPVFNSWIQRLEHLARQGPAP